MNTNLSEGFLFASGALGALSLLLVIALVRSGVDGMTKIWPLLGPLFGGLLGTVTTSYFADGKLASVREAAASQVAMLASNVSVALGDLQEENAQLRTAWAESGNGLGGTENNITLPHPQILGGYSSDITPPPVDTPRVGAPAQ